ncbi:MAG: HAMP domain-containing sensor histidine kinase [Thermoleophilia bacterium]
MTFRTRIAVATAAAVALAVLLSVFAVYNATASTLRGQVDSDLRNQAVRGAREFMEHPPPGDFGGPTAGGFGDPGRFEQVIDPSGQAVNLPEGQRSLPVTAEDAAVAQGGEDGHFSTVRVQSISMRVLTVPLTPGRALQVARPLTEVNATLGSMRNRLVMIGIAGTVLAGLLGALVAARGVRPVRLLAGSVDHVARTGDLTHRIPVSGNDEPARLARRFNEMMDGLERARNAQDQLVADASHELRTPLTAVRANIELLTSGAPLDAHDRDQLLRDLTVQLDGVGGLVGDLVELARGDRPLANRVRVPLDEVVHDAAARARAFWPTARIEVSGESAPVLGDPDALGRAVGNLIDNAVKYGGQDGPVEVGLADGVVTVRDHGPGVPAEDRDRVFARFWRSPSARSRVGTGLGLAIVRQVALSHGGDVRVDDAPGGGAVFRLSVPVAPADDAGPARAPEVRAQPGQA